MKCNALQVLEQGAGPWGWQGRERGLEVACASRGFRVAGP